MVIIRIQVGFKAKDVFFIITIYPNIVLQMTSSNFPLSTIWILYISAAQTSALPQMMCTTASKNANP